MSTFVVVTDKDEIIAETLSLDRSKTLNRYKRKWLAFANNPASEWRRRQRRGFRVAQVQVVEV